MTAALLLLSAALLVWASPEALVARRLEEVRATGPPEQVRATAAPAVSGGPVRRWLLAGVAGAAGGVLIGGPVGLVLAAGGTLAGERFLRRASDDRQATRAVLLRDLPGACDLLAVCLSAGVPMTTALAAVASAVPGPVGDELGRVAALGRLGADPRRAWAEVPAELTPLARVVERSGDSGARATPAIAALAADRRAQARADIEVAVRRAGVWVLAPLGLCFLPAFVCLGVVPLVLGLAGDVLG